MVEDGTSAAAVDGGTAGAADVADVTPADVAPETTTDRPNDLSMSTNCVALICSSVVFSDTGVFAFWAYDTVGWV